MTYAVRNLCCISALLILSSCLGNEPKKSKGLSFSGEEVLFVSAGSLKVRPDSISGTGAVVFNRPLKEVSSNEGYDLSFKLQEGGSLVLVSHASNQLVGGVNIRWVRAAGSLHVFYDLAGKSVDFSEMLSESGKERAVSLDANGDLRFLFDVHNAENPVHSLIWAAFQPEVTEESSLVNTAVLALEGRGAGSYWGLILKDATVTRALRGSPRMND